MLILYPISSIFLKIKDMITSKKIKNQRINILIQIKIKKIQISMIYEKESEIWKLKIFAKKAKMIKCSYLFK